MKVACLVSYPLDRVPGQRFRLEQWRRPLLSLGIELDFLPILDGPTMDILYKPGQYARKTAAILRGTIRRASWAVRHAPTYDVVVIFREATLLRIDWIERYLAPRVPTVFDFDDAIWLPNVSPANRSFGWLKSASKTDRIIARCTAVSAGCEHLAAHARRLNQNTHLVPTSIDLSAYGPPRTHAASEVFTIGWSGSMSTAPYVEIVIPAIRRLSREMRVRLVLMGGRVDAPALDVESIAWTPEAEPGVLRSFDVGIKPLPREDWVLGKCPMKELQYMSVGVPPVATRFGSALESIDDGRTGFLCDTEDDWVNALRALRDVSLRERMGGAARHVVEQRYSAESSAARFAAVLENARDTFAHRMRPERNV